MADARHVRFARELEARDASLAADLDAVRALQADVAELRAHAGAVLAFAEAYPEEQRRLERVLGEARCELHAREAELEAAEADLARAKEGEPRAAAQRAVARTRDAAGSARKRVAGLEHEGDALDRERDRGEAELPRLHERAAELAERVVAAPRASAVPPEDDLVDWSSRARASLFVAASSLETERERVVREANELLAAALGDPSPSANVTLVRARIEQS